MFLEQGDIERINKVRDFILKTTSPDLLKRCKCRGTGLSNVSFGRYHTYWDSSSYCDDCKGVGYHNPSSIDTSLYQCSFCNGEGYNLTKTKDNIFFKEECSHCKGFGFLDWIENLFGKK